ncbi:Transmembrane E3 ubiquitin-protein ligase 1 [Coniochaeta hoffmannii]|uniref:DSC E3 ubiquitin ligase complex subunit A n=1 Tax=Coniochaeta hoffmannii TaxID=91930 RepID=A0AA38RB37_9PEZI|nr:Transmembrane E3 ubiquitin-protein ligase 1 [Coniochaeta hoffmannii]
MPQPQENARAFIVIILLFWLLTSPDNSGALIGIPSLTSARLQRQRFAHGILNSTKWGDFSPRLIDDQADATPHYLNLTGFREQDGFAWEDFGRFKDRCTEWSRNAHGSSASGENLWDLGLIEPTWQNVTGVVHGEWVRRNGSVPRQGADYNLSAISPDVPWMPTRGDYSHNVTGEHGKITLYLDDKDHSIEFDDRDHGDGPKAGGLARAISASVTMQDDATSSSSWDMKFHGVHWPRQGVILLTSTSEKFAGIFGLPHLTLGPSFFYSSQKLLNKTLDDALRSKERNRFSDPSNPWSSNIEPEGQNWSPTPHCEYILYAQVHPLDPQQLGIKRPGDKAPEMSGLGSLVGTLENELRHPTGAPVGGYPELKMSTVMWSPDCSYFLESKGPPVFASIDGNHLTGKKEEILIYGGKMWLMAFAAVFLGQVYLLKAQMRESNTPSTVGRVSFYTAGTMLLADGLIFAGSSAWTLSASSTLLPSLLMTFGAFLSMALGGVFLGEVYKVQEPERRNRQREQAAANPTPPTPAALAAAAATARAAAVTPAAPAAPPLLSDSLPRPVTAPPLRPDTPPIIIPSDQDIDAEIAEVAANARTGAAAIPVPAAATPAVRATIAQPQRTPFSSISGRFILLGTLLLFVSVAAISWPAPIRAFYCNLLAFIYFSLWVPQIYRNIIRNSRRAYSWRFMIGQSVLRAAPVAYFYLRDDNILFAMTDPLAFTVLAGWLWVQLWVLAFQDVLGPRYGLPKGWLPEAWDYHPVLREDNLEAGGLPIGLVGGADDDNEPGSPVTRRASVSDGSSSKSTRKVDRSKDGKDGKSVRAHVYEIDCAICRETLEVPVVPAGTDPDAVGAGGSVAATLARRTYMVTPCRHIFHSACLEGWLRFRLQCPICREELPPL